jgi:hypothetical protein
MSTDRGPASVEGDDVLESRRQLLLAVALGGMVNGERRWVASLVEHVSITVM